MYRILTVLCTLLFSFTVYAEDMSIYEAEVDVDATAENSATAREKAMTEANRKALYAVTNRISSASSTEILDQLNDNQILNFIQEVSVISEKVSGIRYLASFKITINAKILKAYLTDKNAPISIMPETHISIVPVLQKGNSSTPLLWEDENDWYTAWQNNTMQSGQITLYPLPKTEHNQEVLRAEDALQLNKFSLDSVNKTNGSIYIAHAILSEDGLKVSLTSSQAGTVFSKTYPTKDYEKAIDNIKKTILQQIQQQTLSHQNASNTLAIVFNYTTLSEWMALQKELSQIDGVKNFEVETLTNGRAQFQLEYIGSIENLQHNLATKNFVLTDSGNFYTIERI